MPDPIFKMDWDDVVQFASGRDITEAQLNEHRAEIEKILENTLTEYGWEYLGGVLDSIFG